MKPIYKDVHEQNAYKFLHYNLAKIQNTYLCQLTEPLIPLYTPNPKWKKINKEARLLQAQSKVCTFSLGTVTLCVKSQCYKNFAILPKIRLVYGVAINQELVCFFTCRQECYTNKQVLGWMKKLHVSKHTSYKNADSMNVQNKNCF